MTAQVISLLESVTRSKSASEVLLGAFGMIECEPARWQPPWLPTVVVAPVRLGSRWATLWSIGWWWFLSYMNKKHSQELSSTQASARKAVTTVDVERREKRRRHILIPLFLLFFFYNPSSLLIFVIFLILGPFSRNEGGNKVSLWLPSMLTNDVFNLLISTPVE